MITGIYDIDNYFLENFISLDDFEKLILVNKYTNKFVCNNIIYRQYHELKTISPSSRLNYIVKNGYIEIIKRYEIREIDALKYSAEYGQLDILKYLTTLPIIKSDNNFFCDKNNEIFFDLALKNGHLEIVDYLLSIGAKIPYPYLKFTDAMIKNGNLEIMQYLISKFNIDVTDDDNEIIQLACSENADLSIVRYLVSIGADVTGGNNYAIQCAAKYGHTEMVRYLVSVGADATDGDNYAIRRAAKNGHTEIVRYLVSIGADVTANDNYAIRRSAEGGHIETVRYLVSIGADVTADNNYAIQCAVKNDHIELVYYLVSVGADITANNNYAIRRAAKNGHMEIVRYLVSVGADITAKRNSSIQCAARNGHMEIVRYLVSVGADITAENNLALRWAAMNGHMDIVRYLAIGADLTFDNIQQYRIAKKKSDANFVGICFRLINLIFFTVSVYLYIVVILNR